MLAPPPLNRLPAGLLDFFGIKSGGRYPQQLVETLQPTVELWDHYVAANALAIGGNINVAVDTDIGPIDITATVPINLANGTTLDVPTNELWYIQYAHVLWQLDISTDTASAGLRVIEDNIGMQFPMQVAGGWTVGAAAPNLRGGVATLTRPFWVRPGSRVQYYVHGLETTAGSIALQFGMRLARLLL